MQDVKRISHRMVVWSLYLTAKQRLTTGTKTLYKT